MGIGEVSAMERDGRAPLTPRRRARTPAKVHNRQDEPRGEFPGTACPPQRAQAAAPEKGHPTSMAARVSIVKARGRQYELRISELESAIANRDHEIARLEAELAAIRKAALSDKLVMRDYSDALRGQVAGLPALRAAQQQLTAQVEDLIANLQTESTQIVTLIDTVQSSRFWGGKRWLGRLRALVLRR